jgi:predicted dehydrogenase
MTNATGITRREFISAGAAAVGGAVFTDPVWAHAKDSVHRKMRVALVGTGVRGARMFGRDLLRDYGAHVEMVGLCDLNPGRLQYVQEFIGTAAPTFTRLDQMLTTTRPEWLIVTSWDWEHHNNVIDGMRHGANIIVEKPLTIDEQKAQAILDAQRRYGRDVIVTHNYRYSPHRGKLKELLMQGLIGEITSVDFHWHIRQSHLQQYMRRWHGHRDRGGTLWLHKACHHFDLMNWWLDSDPVEVFAWADLERFGENGPYRGPKCRTCPHKSECYAYWDITENPHLVRMYVENEHHDGYIRDNCVFRESIDIYDKHAAVIKYANNAYVNYSLTGESDYEGFWVAFNGTKGRIEGREGGGLRSNHQDWIVKLRSQEPRIVRAPYEEGGHWGGDPIMMDKLFKDPDAPDPLHQAAGTRDGVMAVLVGVAARKSAESGAQVRIADLTDLQPSAVRPRA